MRNSNLEEKDRPLGQRGRLTLSTVASAKGYDAYCVLLASASAFSVDVTGRANFYVGCTRAIEYLEVFAYEERGLVREFREVLERMKSRSQPVVGAGAGDLRIPST